MKRAVISITGQISGNNTLKQAVQTMDCDDRKAGFNNYYLFFYNREEAEMALQTGFEYLTNQEPEFHQEGGISLYNNNLCYDASRASLLSEADTKSILEIYESVNE